MTDFVSIPVNFNLPGSFAEFNDSKAQRGLSGIPHKVLLIGQKTANGNAVANSPILLSEGLVDNYLGKKSILAGMARFAFEANPYQEFWALPLADNDTATAAVYKINITDTVLTSATTLYLYFAGMRIAIALSGGNADATVDEIKSALDAIDTLPIASTTAIKTGSDKSVAITMANAGVISNGFLPFLNALEGETTPAGMTIAITQTTTGAGAPTASTITGALGDEWWTEIVNPYRTTTAITSALDTALADRDGGVVQKPAHNLWQ